MNESTGTKYAFGKTIYIYIYIYILYIYSFSKYNNSLTLTDMGMAFYYVFISVFAVGGARVKRGIEWLMHISVLLLFRSIYWFSTNDMLMLITVIQTAAFYVS